MRETRADTVQALLLALLLHVLLFGLAFIGLWWTRDNAVSAAGSPVVADLIDPNALSAAARRTLAAPPRPAKPLETPPPQPIPEPRPQESPVPQQQQAQERVPVPDVVEQERVDREAEAAELRQREQEEKHRQEQVDLTERERQAEAEQKQRLAQQLDEIRKAKAKAAREASLAEQKLQQIADARSHNAAEEAAQADADASAPPGNNGIDESLLAKYQAAIQAAIRAQWVKPDSVASGDQCRLTIRQLPGGEVMDGSVSFGSPCQFDEAARDSIERAVLKAQPLPYAGYESVFRRTLNLTFHADE
ncbi:MAG: cell envelope integrity protein TolA [Luteimonas sp.]